MAAGRVTSRIASRLIAVALVGGVLVACADGPSKTQAFETIQASIKEDGSCVLPLEILTTLKVQFGTKGICVPREGADKARACVNALVAAHITKPMPETYMLTWPDEVSGASLSDIPASSRSARNLIYIACVELGDLRDGRFPCADVRAEKVIKVTATDPVHADVRYERDIKLKPTLAAIEAACGTVTRPPGESTVAFAKNASGWVLASAAGDAGPN